MSEVSKCVGLFYDVGVVISWAVYVFGTVYKMGSKPPTASHFGKGEM